MIKWGWVLAFVMLVPTFSFAQSSPVDLKRLPRSYLQEERAPAHYTEVQFAKQVGQSLNRYSSRTGYEACADICRSSTGTWAALPVSIGSHTSCSTLRMCPAGSKAVGRMIHSHPVERQFEANGVDFALRGLPFIPGRIWFADDPRLFSEADYREPGYMVVYGQLYFQKGKGTEASLGVVGADTTSQVSSK